MQDIAKFNNLKLGLIDPKNHSKYSPNLYNFLKKERNEDILKYSQVYIDEEGVFYIGYYFDNSFIGSRLMSVLGDGGRAQKGCYSYFREANQNLTHIKTFWKKYIKFGRCAIDPEHKMYFIGDDSRWDVSKKAAKGNLRKCLWCNNCIQKKESLD